MHLILKKKCLTKFQLWLLSSILAKRVHHSTPLNSLMHILIDLALCTSSQSTWLWIRMCIRELRKKKKEGTIPNLFPQRWGQRTAQNLLERWGIHISGYLQARMLEFIRLDCRSSAIKTQTVKLIPFHFVVDHVKCYL